ncbi:MAG: hypothetical protein ACI3VB_07755 [Oscillospiraceae bacterium]
MKTKKLAAIILAVVLCLSLAACGDEQTTQESPGEPRKQTTQRSPEELLTLAGNNLALTMFVSDYVTEYYIAGMRGYVEVPVTMPPGMWDGYNDTTVETAKSIDLTSFEPTEEEPGAILGSFVVRGNASCVVEYGCMMTMDEYYVYRQQMNGPPEQMTLTFTFMDNGESVTAVGDWLYEVEDVDSRCDCGDGTIQGNWQMYCMMQGEDPANWVEVSEYAYQVAVITSYFDDGTVEGPSEHRSLYSSALISDVIMNVPICLVEPSEAPSDFHVDREVEILGSDWGVCTFDLDADYLCVGGNYYSLKELDSDSLAGLHQALYDYDY